MPDDNQQPSSPPHPSSDERVDESTLNNGSPAKPEQSIKPTTPSQPAPQPGIVVSGQSYDPTIPSPSDQNGQISEQKPSRWRYFFIVLGVLQALGVAVFVLVMLWAGEQAKAGLSGTEFIGLALFVTVVPAVAVISLINLIGLPIYMTKRKLRGRGRVFAMVSLLISALLALYGMYGVYQLFAVSNKHAKQSEQKSEQRKQEFAAANAKPEITKEEAIQLLQTCKLKGFYYTNQTDKSDPVNGGWGELSSTGVVLTKVNGEPYRISIADKLIPELVPIAREAQKTCVNPQFWHDGAHEQYKDGKWYFNGQVVNSVQSGKTKEQAIGFMRDCKADYFVGYTGDINVIKDENTKSWLRNAEQSTIGIAISENPPKTYVFTSKAMTAQLQDTARQFRQACYNQKKLYIQIDDWIETEYPAGSWTRVKQ